VPADWLNRAAQGKDWRITPFPKPGSENVIQNQQEDKPNLLCDDYRQSSVPSLKV